MKYLILIATLLPAMAFAQQFQPNQHSTVTVTASNGAKCTMEVAGSSKPSPSAVAAIQKDCERQQRGKAILAITGPTEADLMAMSPTDRAKAVKALRCKDVRDKLDMQRDLEAAGSTGYYNKTTLLELERKECGSNAAH
ncbi:hypothetical protein LQ772_06865 [Frateuria edaphi]|uniref:hypothetical protein n=1 Tax=Frateuria edaphi TaxID=2898793 RepID=UPI001E5BB717|nr:hypothetical protein [Frateuria edaphi]UGB47007.1 hypothetical protein LQ772_06865 [Frateuria edaphi]